MLKNTRIVVAVSLLSLLMVPALAIAQEGSSVRHASVELIDLAADFRDFRSPLFARVPGAPRTVSMASLTMRR